MIYMIKMVKTIKTKQKKEEYNSIFLRKETYERLKKFKHTKELSSFDKAVDILLKKK